MSDMDPRHVVDLRQQLLTRLVELRGMGIDWMPSVEPLAVALPLNATEAEEIPAMDPHHPDYRLKELEVLRDRVKTCDRCPELVATRSQTVFGVGPLDPELCFIGEAPGADEDRQGFPFVGAAGQLLTKIIEACGMQREEVYICNILRCRPPGNRVPKASEAANCREYLDRQLELVRPKFICALGATAAKSLLGTTKGIGQLRGQFFDYKGIPVICTFHPASLLPSRSPENKKLVWEDMKMLLTRMGKPIPSTKKDGGPSPS